jgi:uncharacterized membrane protein
VNHIVDRIARETEQVIDELMPDDRGQFYRPQPPAFTPEEPEFPLFSEVSGYIRFIDTKRLLRFAKARRLRIRVTRPVGHFVPAGVPLLMVSHSDRIEPSHAAELTGAFDLGPMRTLQQDVEFGVIQIVDIALRAISPAVNDPSTAISCIDQLSRILIRWLRRFPPETHLFSPPHVLRVVVPWIDLEGMLNTTLEQIRAYATGDAAVSLRLMRLLQDVAVTVESDAVRHTLISRGERIVAGCRTVLPLDDVEHLERRLVAMRNRPSA